MANVSMELMIFHVLAKLGILECFANAENCQMENWIATILFLPLKLSGTYLLE
jgi:hypothetical protein